MKSGKKSIRLPLLAVLALSLSGLFQHSLADMPSQVPPQSPKPAEEAPIVIEATAATASTYRYAYAYQDCAPWDGSAWRIVLRNKTWPFGEAGLPDATFPYFGISLWSMSPPRNKWIEINSQDPTERKGQIVYCPSGRYCQGLKGQVRLTHMTPTQIRGELRFTSSGKSQEGVLLPFQAAVYPHPPLCG